MKAAEKACKELSTEDYHPTGAVLVKKKKIIGRGGNQSALKHQKLRDFHKNYFCVRRLLNVKTGKKYWLCPGCASLSMHGERQALKDAQKRQNDTRGADLYLWGHWWACESCWKALGDSGVSNLYLLKNSEVLFNREDPANDIGNHLSARA